ncbi:hypothetical protein ACFQJ5_16760 [Halomicroarcula sp. GCM10025324]|uniref:hypothetical protein n=1 Tax=Haloarcula TaxID=2237 RepID=UPI0023E768FD|nr:hypothetical protein [Halomicroarcula sp. ZS-22-S1]
MTTSLTNLNRAGDLSTDGDGEFRCEYCNARCTRSPTSNLEYGHLTGCPQRPDDLPKGGGYVSERDQLDVGQEVA